MMLLVFCHPFIFIGLALPNGTILYHTSTPFNMWHQKSVTVMELRLLVSEQVVLQVKNMAGIHSCFYSQCIENKKHTLAYAACSTISAQNLMTLRIWR